MTVTQANSITKTITKTITERLDEEKARQKAREGVWGPIIRHREKEHADFMHKLALFGGVMRAAYRDGRRAEPNPDFLKPHFSMRGVYLQVYAIQFYMRKGFSKEEAVMIEASGYRYY